MEYSPLAGLQDPTDQSLKKKILNATPQAPTSSAPDPTSGLSQATPSAGFPQLTQSGDLYDMSNVKPEKGQIDFRQFLLPISAQGPNSERKPAGGEPKAIASNDGASTDFHDNSGADPDLEEASRVTREGLAASRAARDSKMSAVDVSNQPLSTGRKIAGIAAGVGMGIISRNPIAGLNLGQYVANYGRNKAVASANAQGAAQDEFAKEADAGAKNLSSLSERRTARRNAETEATKAQTAADNAANETEYTEVGGPTPGSKQRVAVPKHPKPGEVGKSTNVGPAMTPAPHESAAQFEIKENADGTYIRIDKNDPNNTQPVTVKLANGTLAPMKANLPEFEQYMDALRNQDPVTADKIIKYREAGAIQAGANAQNLRDEGQKDAAGTARLKAAVDTIFERSASVNPKLRTDPQAAYTERTKILNSFANHPDVSKYIPNLQKLPEFKPPTGKAVNPLTAPQ